MYRIWFGGVLWHINHCWLFNVKSSLYNKLQPIQPILKERKLDPNNTRREETTLTRLRIGHPQLTPLFLKKNLSQNVHGETNSQSSTFWENAQNLTTPGKSFIRRTASRNYLKKKKKNSQKHNQLLKNNWPPIKNIDYYQHLRPSSVYKQKALTYFKILIPDCLFTNNIHFYIYIYIYIKVWHSWPLRG